MIAQIRYIKVIRELEKVLGFAPKPFLPALKPGWEGRWYRVPIISLKMSLLALAIHEIRHRIQKELKVKLISLEEAKHLLSPEEIGLVRSAFTISPREEDAEIAERIGVRLLEQGKVEEFRELMLRSKVPSKL
jgi:hypothetical protein